MPALDVVRLMYKMVAKDGCSTIEVADYFNALGIPPSYVKDGHKVRKASVKKTPLASGGQGVLEI